MEYHCVMKLYFNKQNWKSFRFSSVQLNSRIQDYDMMKIITQMPYIIKFVIGNNELMLVHF
jgi:hypothetical protein